MAMREFTLKHPLTKRAFERLLKRAAQPLPNKESDSKGIRTSAAHPSDGYSGKYRNQGKTEGAKG